MKAEAKEIPEVQRIEIGTETYYQLKEKTFRDCVIGWEIDREKRFLAEQTIEELNEKWKQETECSLQKIKEVHAQYEKEMRSKEAEVKREKRKQHYPGLGLFVGPGWTPEGIQVCIGIGLVLKLQ